MLVHLVGSSIEIKENIEHLRRLVAVIEHEGHEVVNNWVDEEYKIWAIEGKGHEKIDWSLQYKESIEREYRGS